MSHTRLTALVLTVSALTAAGCGGSTKTSSQSTSSATVASSADKQSSDPTASLTRAQLIAKGDAICYRLNARRASTKVSSPEVYARVVPALAAYELAGAAEMSKLIPPPAMAHAWQKIASSSRTIAEVTGFYPSYANAGNHKKTRSLVAILTKATEELQTTAKREGFTDCAQFE